MRVVTKPKDFWLPEIDRSALTISLTSHFIDSVMLLAVVTTRPSAFPHLGINQSGGLLNKLSAVTDLEIARSR